MKKAIAVTVLTIILIFSGLSCSKKDTAESAQKAFELRMSGKLDEALKMLEESLAQNPDDAAVHFELARTYHHQALGDPRQLMVIIKKSTDAMDKATALAPDNIVYAYYGASIAFYNAYMGLRGDTVTAKNLVGKLCSAYENTLRLDPEYPEALLYLTEIYSTLPSHYGGDSAKAQAYAARLEEIDEIFGLKARSLLLGEDGDIIAYWNDILKTHPGNAAVLEELGKAYWADEIGPDGNKYIQDALAADPSRTDLNLDMARYNYMVSMRNGVLKEFSLNFAEKAIDDYLTTEPIRPMKAFALGLLSLIKSKQGDSEKSDSLAAQAEALDPYYSRALGIPPQELFTPADEIVHRHSYLLRPY